MRVGNPTQISPRKRSSHYGWTSQQMSRKTTRVSGILSGNSRCLSCKDLLSRTRTRVSGIPLGNPRRLSFKEKCTACTRAATGSVHLPESAFLSCTCSHPNRPTPDLQLPVPVLRRHESCTYSQGTCSAKRLTSRTTLAAPGTAYVKALSPHPPVAALPCVSLDTLSPLSLTSRNS